MVSLNRDALTDKVLEGKRISPDEALALYQLPLEELGALADARRNLAKEKSYGGRGGGVGTHIAGRNNHYTNGCKGYFEFFAVFWTGGEGHQLVVSLGEIEPEMGEVFAACA